MSETTALVFFDQARHALEHAARIDEVKQIRDQAEVMRQYMRQQRQSHEMQNRCAEIKIRAERRIGELLLAIQRQTAGRPEKNSSHDPTNLQQTLASFDLERSQAYRYQVIAKMPATDFEIYIAESKATNELTSAGIYATARQEQKRAEVTENLESVATRDARILDGTYDVIIIDPPWPMEKIERRVRPNQVGFDYPTMTVEELQQLAIPCAADCHVWLWTTPRFLFVAGSLLDAWAMRYVCPFVWHKPGGFQPVGLPQYNCEFALYARYGAPAFLDTKAFPLCFEAPRTGHSAKPEEFYATVRRVTAGRRLDMFNRRHIEGFEAWGKEA